MRIRNTFCNSIRKACFFGALTLRSVRYCTAGCTDCSSSRIRSRCVYVRRPETPMYTQVLNACLRTISARHSLRCTVIIARHITPMVPLSRGRSSASKSEIRISLNNWSDFLDMLGFQFPIILIHILMFNYIENNNRIHAPYGISSAGHT